MNVRQLESILTNFNLIAKNGDRNRTEGEPYIVDVFTIAGGDRLTGTIHNPDKQTGLVRLDVQQYGEGTDWNACYIDVEAIAAVRIRKIG